MRNIVNSDGELSDCIAFDIEVVPAENTDEYIDRYKEFKAPSNYKSDDAIEKYIANAKIKERSRAALHPPTQKIWVICAEIVKSGEKHVFESLDEASLLVAFYLFLASHSKHVLFGFNSRSYDVPALINASLRHNIQLPKILKNPGNQSDILDDFYHTKIKLNDLAFVLNRSKLMSGEDVGQKYMMYCMGDDSARDSIVEYCQDDVNLCAEYVRRVYGY